MALTYLAAKQLRIFEQFELTPDPRLNLILGPNAAGKTSILEAIYILGLGRSFRTRSIAKLIKNGQTELQVIGKSLKADMPQKIGISRTRQQFQIRINNESYHRLSDLAAAVPVQCLTPETHFGFFRSAKHRRAALDWGVFHVEQSFINIWSDYKQVLRQRNAALKGRVSDKLFEPWEKQLSESALTIHLQRQKFIARFNPLVNEFYHQFNEKLSIEIRLAAGWPDERLLFDALVSHRQQDQKRGFTLYGPHRGDLKIFIDKKPADQASSGQQKLAVIAIRMAQIVMMNEYSNVRPILLLDDLLSELDARHRESVLLLLQDLPAQIFMTATDLENLGNKKHVFEQTFHVEQGEIQQ
ncbi:MAG: DNA replication/repair protein RecF [Acidiferrobacterales bacterium]